MTTATAGDASSTAAPPAAVPGQATAPAPAANPQAAPATQPSTPAPAASAAPASPTPPAPAAPAAPAADASKTGDAAKQPDQPKPGEKPAAPAAPAPLELKLPADAKVDATALASVKALADQHKLAPEVAQAVLEHGNALVKGYEDAVKAKWSAQTAQWLADIKADPEVGGDKYAAAAENVARFSAKFFGADLVKEMTQSGMDRHPWLFKALARAGAAMRDDRIDAPSGGGGGSAQGDALAQAIATEIAAANKRG